MSWATFTPVPICVYWYTTWIIFVRGRGLEKSYVILMGGHAKCLLLITRGEGEGSKIPKTCLRNTWMFPNEVLKTLNCLTPDQEMIHNVHFSMEIWKNRFFQKSFDPMSYLYRVVETKCNMTPNWFRPTFSLNIWCIFIWIHVSYMTVWRTV